MRSILFPLFIVCSTLIVGCGSSVPVIRPFKMDIQQGNVVTSKMLLQLRPGMTKSQVKFIMGTPLVVDSFHTNRWDYFYQLRQAGKVVEQRRVILDFEKDLLARVRGDVVPQGTPGADTGAVTLAKEPLPATVKPAPKEGVFENLKFWKNRDPSKEKSPKNNDAKPAAEQLAPQAIPTSPQAKPVESAPAQSVPQESISAEPAPTSESATPEASPATETPSMLAVPIVIPATENAPAEAKPDQTPVQQSVPSKSVPNKVEPAASESKPEVEAAPVTEPAKTPSTPDSDLPAKKDDAFIFRLERDLNTKEIELETPAKKPSTQSSGKESTNATDKDKAIESEPATDEEEPGYFEKMLEKIGF